MQFSGTPFPLKSDYVTYGWYLTRQYWAKRPSIPVNFQCPYCQIQHLSIVCWLFYCHLHLEKKEKKNSDEKQWQIHWIYCVIRWCKFIALFDGDFHIKCVRVSRCNREKKIKGGLISEIIINFVPISNKCTKSMIINYLNVMGKVDGLWFGAFFLRCTLNMRFSHL